MNCTINLHYACIKLAYRWNSTRRFNNAIKILAVIYLISAATKDKTNDSYE